MASNILSRLLPANNGSTSVYEAIREHDNPVDDSDIEDHADLALDEQNLDERFQDQELEDLLREDPVSLNATAATPFLGRGDTRQRQTSRSRSTPRRMRDTSGRALSQAEDDDDVPESLLLEDDRYQSNVGRKAPAELPPPVPGPTSPRSKIQWDTTRAQQKLHDEPRTDIQARESQMRSGLLLASAEEKAMWRWANVTNVDNFLHEVYGYYIGNGFWSIQLSRLLGLLTSLFVVGFTTFLLACVDYKEIPNSKHMSEILVPKCTNNMSGLSNLLIWSFTFFWIWKVFHYALDVRRLWHLHDFYLYLLGIPDKDVQTISWQEIVGRLMNLRESNPFTALNITPASRRYVGSQSKQRMDAHDIANRLMRRENYLIALFNKDILDLTLPVPFLKERQWFSKTLEYTVQWCVLDYVFNRQGQVQQLFLKDSHRKELIDGLRRRFVFAGLANVICAPFAIPYFLVLYFMRYFTEFQKNPSEIGSRSYSPLAEWKFREFNELWHLFQRRTNMSRPFASRYIDQFPKDKTVQIAKFVAFVAGALAAVLFVASLLDPDVFLGFEITPERTVLFYLGIFGTAWAVARGMVPADDLVYDPEFTIKNVIDYTHYYPSQWKGQLHSDEVRQEFSSLYQMKIVIFLEEMLSLVVTPFVLWFALPQCSERVVDFFREFTIHVDGLGYVCSFAVFDFNRGTGPGKHGAGDYDGSDLRGEYYATKDDKMLTSYYYFMDSYANNPKGGRYHNYPAQRHFQPPPAFPGLMSPTMRAETSGTVWKDAAHRANGGLQSTFRSPPTRAVASHTSPSPSLLLDPQHQPARSALRKGRRAAMAGSRLGKSIDEAEELGIKSQLRQAPTSSTILEEDSHLGESWRTGRAGDADAEDETDDDDDDAGGAGGVVGVLGMISRLAEGQGAGVDVR